MMARNNGNGCHEALPMAPFSASNIGSLRFASFAAARLMVPPMNQLFGSMSYVRQGLNVNPQSNLRGSQQFVRQIIPTFASHFTRMNYNNGSSHNGSDHKNFNSGQ